MRCFSWVACLGFLVGCLWILPALAQQADGVAAPARAELADARMPDLVAFVDGIVSSSLEQHKIGGAQIAIVKDSETLLVKGYGLAAIAPERRVDPNRSLFRIGSISKTFTWIGIMQLVEQGRIALDDPVNQYLPAALQLPAEGYARPIRIIDLMNHTPGFEDSLQNLFIGDPSKVLPLIDHLRRFRPARVREPGQYVAYSNYGVALAGALIEYVTGTEYQRYIEENVLVPLGMHYTTFREEIEPGAPKGLPAPMSPELVQNKAQGLEYRGGAWRAYEQEHILSLAPAGSAVSTAADMARYMTALLNPELLEQAGVLGQETYQQMRRPSFQAAPGLPAVHHGFFNMPLGARRALGFDNLSHAGGTLHFQSLMVLIPEIELPTGESAGSLGVFVTTNSQPGAILAQALTEQLLTRYFAAPAAATAEPVEMPHALSDYVGSYRGMRRSYTKLEKLFGLVQTMRLSQSADGFLVLQGGREAVRLVEIADDLFRQQNSDVILAFERDARGKVTHAITVAGAAERIGWFDSLAWASVAAAATGVASIGIIIGAVWRRRRSPSQTRHEQLSARWLVVVAVSWLTFWISLVLWLVAVLGPDAQDRLLLTYPQTSLKVALTVLLLAAAMSAMAVATLIPVWRDASWTLWRRIRHSAAVASFLVFVATAAHWNMLGFRFH